MFCRMKEKRIKMKLRKDTNKAFLNNNPGALINQETKELLEFDSMEEGIAAIAEALKGEKVRLPWETISFWEDIHDRTEPKHLMVYGYWLKLKEMKEEEKKLFDEDDFSDYADIVYVVHMLISHENEGFNPFNLEFIGWCL